MNPEQKARESIDKKLIQSGWVIQDLKSLNLSASLGIAIQEFPTNTGPVDYALFVDGEPVGIIEAKKSEIGEKITSVEENPRAMQTASLSGLRGNTISVLPMKQRTR